MTGSLEEFTSLGDESFLSLTTFRKSGDGVATTVWVARAGDELVVITPAGTGKVKRIRNNGRVTLRPSSRSGKVAEGAIDAAGHAVIETDERETARLTQVLADKYGMQFRLSQWIERVFSRKKPPRVVLRISPSAG